MCSQIETKSYYNIAPDETEGEMRIKCHPWKESKQSCVLSIPLCSLKQQKMRVRTHCCLTSLLPCVVFCFFEVCFFLYILIGCLSLIVEFQELFIYSEYKSFDRYI